MNLVTFFLIGLMTLNGGPGGPAKQPAEGEPGEDTYYKYEREEVSVYRDRADFGLPEPILPAGAQAAERPEPEALSGYFQPDQAYYIDAAPELERLTDTHKQINARIKQVPGYRIQVYSGTARAQADRVYSQFLARENDLKQTPYKEFIAPNFVVRVGDFMNKEEATLFFKREIEGLIRGAFVVPDKVNVPTYEDLVETERRREERERMEQNADPFDNNNNEE